MGLERFEECAKHFNRELQEEGRLIVPEGHPLQIEQERLAARLVYLIEEWPREVLNDESILATSKRLGIRQEDMPTVGVLSVMLRELLVVQWPSIDVQVDVGAPPPQYMAFGGWDSRPGVAVRINAGDIKIGPFKVLKWLCTGGIAVAAPIIAPLAIVALTADILDHLIKFHPLSAAQRRALIDLVATRKRYERPVSTLEIAAVRHELTPLLINYVDDLDLTSLQKDLLLLKDKELVLEVKKVESQTVLSPVARKQLQLSHVGSRTTQAVLPESGVWDTSVPALQQFAKLYRRRLVKVRA